MATPIKLFSDNDQAHLEAPVGMFKYTLTLSGSTVYYWEPLNLPQHTYIKVSGAGNVKIGISGSKASLGVNGDAHYPADAGEKVPIVGEYKRLYFLPVATTEVSLIVTFSNRRNPGGEMDGAVYELAEEVATWSGEAPSGTGSVVPA